MNIASSILTAFNARFSWNFSTGNSEDNSGTVSSAIPHPFSLLAAFGLLMKNTRAEFVHSQHDETCFNSAPDLRTFMQPSPRLEIISAHKGTECESRVSEVVKYIHKCPVASEFANELARRGAGIVCTSEDSSSFSTFDPKANKVILSVGENDQYPQSEYMVTTLKELYSLLFAEQFNELESYKCNMNSARYAELRALFLQLAENVSKDIETQCIEEGHWPEDFHLNNLMARKMIEKAISSGRLEETLTNLKNLLQEEELKELEGANEEESIELAMKFLSRVLEREKIFEFSDFLERSNDIAKEWSESCDPWLIKLWKKWW